MCFVAKLRGRKQLEVLHSCSQNGGGQEGGMDVNPFCSQCVQGAMSLSMREGEVGAVGTTNEAAAGYYLVKWPSKPYTLHGD